MFNLLATLPKHKNLKNTDLSTLNNDMSKISIENLSFKFENGYQVLDDISFEFLKNQTVAIMGESGSGKSTLVDLIIGLYQPTKGTISYYNQLGKCELTNYSISYISQSCSLFGNDIYQNICLSNNVNDIDKNRIDEIARSLNLDNFFKDNENKRNIRSDNTNVSGGERQRISIARAKYFDTDIVILDEPTSALDEENKKRVFEYLQEISHKKTVIIVTHSRDLLNITDLVILLEKGRKIFYGPTLEFKAFENRNI